MAEQIGVVVQLIGQARAAGAGGAAHALQLGDAVHANDVVSTSPGAYLVIRFEDGTVLDLGSNAQVVLDGEVYAPDGVPDAELASVEDIQTLLREGGDPTDPATGAEPTAAGPNGVAEDGEGGHTVVIRTQDLVETLPEAGIQTAAEPLAYAQVIYDELPVVDTAAGPGGEVLRVPEAIPVNVVIVFDRSSSMDREVPSLGKTQLEVAQEAVADLLRAYGDTGATVNVLVVDFAGAASASAWLDVDGAIAHVNDLTLSRDTNYRDALETVRESFGTPPSDGQTVVWFFSDGEPWPADGSAPVVNAGRESNELTPADVAAWQAFLDAQNAQAYAIGVRGQWDAEHTGNLDEVASPQGETILLTRFGQLDDAVVDRVENRVEGNVLANDGPDAHVVALAVDGVEYRYDAASDRILGSDGSSTDGATLRVTTDLGGKLTFMFAADGGRLEGGFTYVAPQVDGDRTEVFTYTTTGANGASTLQITVEDQPTAFAAQHTLSMADPAAVDLTGPATTSGGAPLGWQDLLPESPGASHAGHGSAAGLAAHLQLALHAASVNPPVAEPVAHLLHP